MPIYVTLPTLTNHSQMYVSLLPCSTHICVGFCIDSYPTHKVSLPIFSQDSQEVMCPSKDVLQPIS